MLGMKICRSEQNDEKIARRIIRALIAAMMIGLIVMAWYGEKKRMNEIIENRKNINR